MQRPTRNDMYDNIGLQNLPLDEKGYIDEREIIMLSGKAGLSLSDLYDMYPYEFVFYLEGYLDKEREYFEFLNYSLFSSIRQALGKGKNFSNPFEKQKVQPEQRKLTEEEYESEVDAIREIFNL